MSPRATALRFGVLLPAVLLIVAGTTLLGPQWIDWRDILSTTDPSYVFWHLRVPRTLLAAAAGAGLAVGFVARRVGRCIGRGIGRRVRRR